MLYTQAKESEEMVVELRNIENVRQKKSLVSLYLVEKDERVFLPIYFGVACAVASLNLLCARKKMMGRPMNGSSSSNTKAVPAIEGMLRGATQLLGLLIWKMTEKKDAEEWKVEKIGILANVAKAEAEVGEMKKRRAEDAKANEKVVAMFATQEHSWKNEKKTLWQQIEILQARTQIVAVDDKQKCCSECVLKEHRISDLNDKLGEKESVVITIVQAAQAERNELKQKLDRAEAIAQELGEKVSRESEERQAEFQRHKAAFIDFVSNQRQMKAEMGHALRKLESDNRERQIILNERKQAEALIQRLSFKIAHLEKEVQEKEQVMSAMLKRSNADAKENQELEKELKISKALRRQAEFEVERWRRICQSKKDNTAKHSWRLRRGSATRVDSRTDLYTEIKILQAEEIRRLHIKYQQQVEYLQRKISRYEEKLTELEASILLHLGQNERSPCSQKLQLGCSHSGSKDLVHVRDSLEADIDALESQSLVSKDHPIQYIETEQSKRFLQTKNEDPVTRRVLNGFKDWIKLEKARHAARLDQKHWQKLDAFSREMRVKDDRMEALNWHMISMERDTEKLQSEMKILNHNLKQAREEKSTLEALLVEKDHGLELLKEKLDLHQNKLCNKIHSNNLQLRPSEMDAEALRLELKTVKRKLREREREHRAILIKVLEEVENELQGKDYKLAVTKAKLIQVQIQYEQEKKSKEKIISETMKKKNGSRDCSMDHVVGEHESCAKSTTIASCLKVEKLCEVIAEARDHMMQRENRHAKQLNDLIEHAAKVSKAGCQLRTMKNLLQITEKEIENSVECNMSQIFQQELDLSVCELRFHKTEHDVDKHVSDVLHRNDSLGICNLGNIMKHQTEDMIKPAELQEELGSSGDCQIATKLNSINAGNDVLVLRNDTRKYSLSAKDQILIRRSNGFSKGKAITSGQCSTLKKTEQSRDEGYSERKTKRHVTPMEWSKRHKPKVGKNENSEQSSKARLEEDVCMRVQQ